MKIIRVGTYHVLPILMLVQAVSLREHRARCRPHLIKHTTSVLDAKYIKSLELIVSDENYKSGNVPRSADSEARTSCESERASCQMSSFSGKTHTKVVLDSRHILCKHTSTCYDRSNRKPTRLDWNLKAVAHLHLVEFLGIY